MKNRKKAEVPPWIQELGPPPTTMKSAQLSQSEAEIQFSGPGMNWESTELPVNDAGGQDFSSMGLEIKGIGQSRGS